MKKILVIYVLFSFFGQTYGMQQSRKLIKPLFLTFLKRYQHTDKARKISAGYSDIYVYGITVLGLGAASVGADWYWYAQQKKLQQQEVKKS